MSYEIISDEQIENLSQYDLEILQRRISIALMKKTFNFTKTPTSLEDFSQT